jgi:hypothetical protein
VKVWYGGDVGELLAALLVDNSRAPPMWDMNVENGLIAGLSE